MLKSLNALPCARRIVIFRICYRLCSLNIVSFWLCFLLPFYFFWIPLLSDIWSYILRLKPTLVAGMRFLFIFLFFCVFSEYLCLFYICSKSEYVIYKLKELGKVSEKDISQICNKFDRLDSGNCGKITLADLMENHHWQVSKWCFFKWNKGVGTIEISP